MAVREKEVMQKESENGGKKARCSDKSDAEAKGKEKEEEAKDKVKEREKREEEEDMKQKYVALEREGERLKGRENDRMACYVSAQ